MKTIVIVSALLACAAAQGLFGGLGQGLGGGLNRVADIANPNRITSAVNNFADLAGVRTFTDFVAKTGKSYATQAEKTLREGIFKAKMDVVNSHNAAKSTFQLGINQFADLNLDEFLKGLTGLKKSSTGESIAKQHRNQAGPPSSVALPDAFDWREKKCVTQVKFQGLECGACWSFAVTGAIEGHWCAKYGELIELSEQNLVDCGNPFGNTGCDGGFQDYGFECILENKGIARADLYPYEEVQHPKCGFNQTIKGAEIKGYSVIEPGNEEKMKEVIATKGPLACSVNAESDTFQLYKSGVYMDDTCNEGEPNHSILVVGYGSENGDDYWIIKNTWTTKWGEDGFMKLPRNKNSYCKIADECSFPIV